MTCSKCGSSRIYFFDELLCPSCQGLARVPHDDSIIICKHFINTFSKIFFDELNKYKKLMLLTGLFWEREKEAREIYTHHTSLNLNRLFTYSILLKRLMQHKSFLEMKDVSEKELADIVKDMKQSLNLRIIWRNLNQIITSY